VSLKVYNTLSKRKEDFKPVHEGKVSMYVCGVTVYDDIHMGHARSMIVFDMIARYLRYRGYQVDHATNFTDVDDKIIVRAKEQGVPPLQLSSTYIERYFKEADALGVRRADRYPKASEFIPQIEELVGKLVEKGYAYRVQDGSVYFSMEKVHDYGKLSGMKLEELKAGVRVEPGEGKRNPMDFALWKGAKPGEIAWDSPWGKGRPGWHIECSAMCMDLFGDTIDIHGGGNDLIFPHHENEILQSESATGKPLANYWLHNGMLTVQEEKMAKSLKNFFTVRQVLSEHSKEEVRFYLLNTHYHGPLGYSDTALDEAAASLRRLHNTYAELKAAAGNATGTEGTRELVEKARKEFVENMDDDFNSRAAIAAIFDFAREANRLLADGRLSKQGARDAYLLLEEVDQVLGVLPPAQSGKDLDAVMQIIMEIRKELRRRKMFDLADQIRDQLAAQGIKLEDTAEGAKWKRI